MASYRAVVSAAYYNDGNLRSRLVGLRLHAPWSLYFYNITPRVHKYIYVVQLLYTTSEKHQAFI